MRYSQLLARTIILAAIAAVFVVAPVRGQSGQELSLGSAMPMAGTSLANVNGGQSTLTSLAGSSGTVVVFWSNQCPWVTKYQQRFTNIVNAFSSRGIAFVLINSNDASAFPQESAEQSASHFRQAGLPSSVTYLSDASSQLARAFGASRTPHVYVFDANQQLAYVGTIDDSPGDPGNVKEEYLRDALNAVLAGSEVAIPKTKAFGCTIKYAGG